MGDVIGGVGVGVWPESEDFIKSFRRAVLADAKSIGSALGKEIGSGFDDAFDKATKKWDDPITEKEKGAPKRGGEFGGRYGRALKASLAQALRDLPEVEITADSSAADRAIAEVREQLQALHDQRIGVDVTSEEALAELTRLQGRLEEISREHPDVAVRVDTEAASARLREFRKEVEAEAPAAGGEYGGRFATALKQTFGSMLRDLPDIKVSADSSDAERAIIAVREELTALHDQRIGIDVSTEEARRRLVEIRARLEEVSRSHPDVSLRVDIASALAHVQTLRASMRELNVHVDLDTGAARAQLALLQAQAASTSMGMSGMAVAAVALGPALLPIGAVGVGALAGVAAAAGVAAGAIGVVALALAPVIAAVQAVSQAHDKQASSAGSAASREIQLANASDALRAATQRVKQAEEDAARGRERAARQVGDAKRRLADAEREAAQAQEQASRRVARAERDLADAQRSVLDAQQALNDAREQAARDMEDLSSRVANAQLDQREATLRVTEAQQNLNDVMADPTASELDRQRAQLQYDEAIQGLSDQQTELQRLQQQQEDAAKAGIDGSDTVKSAQDQLIEAQQRLADAQQGVADAARDSAEAQRQAAEQVAQAQRALADAEQGRRDQAVDAARQIAAAQQAVVQAQRSVQQASTAAGGATSTALDDARRKMAALPPAGRAFATFLTAELLPALRGLSTPALAGFLPGLQRGLEAVTPLIPSLAGFIGSLATDLGGLAAQAGRALAGPEWGQFFSWAGSMASPTLHDMASAVGSLAIGFAQLMMAFSPAISQFTSGFASMSAEFAKWAAGLGGDTSFQRFIDLVTSSAGPVLKTLGDFGGAVMHLADALAPLGGFIIAVAGGLATFISAVPAPVIQGLAVAFVAVAVGIGLMNAAIFILEAQPIVLIIIGIVAAIAALAIGIYTAYQQVDWFRTGVNAAFAAVGAAARWLWENAIKPAFEAIWGGIQFAWEKVIRPAFHGMSTFIHDVLIPAFNKYLRPQIELSWNLIKTSIELGWSVIQVVFKAIDYVLRTVVGPAFNWLYDKVIKPVWETAIQPVLKALGDYISTTVAPAFQRGVEAIQRAWDGVQAVAKAPVKFIIQTVINDGIISTWNQVAGFFGVKPVEKVKLPKGFATGGYIRGPGGPTDDLVPAMLSHGEYVIRAGAVRQLGTGFLDMVNQADRYELSGDPAALGVRRRFATGGLVQSVPQIQAWLRTLTSTPYVWGGVGPDGYDCSGLTGEVYNRATGRPHYHRVMTTGSDFGALGFSPGTGLYSIGVNDHHMVGDIGGLRFEAPHTGANVRVGSAAQPVSAFPHVYHLTSLGDAAGGGGSGDWLGWVKGLLAPVLAKLDSIGAGPFGQLVAAMPRAAADAVIDRVKELIPGFSDGGLVKYDSGGYLPPGVTRVINATGRPEPVLTGEQWERVRSGAVPGSGQPITVNVTNPAPETPSETVTRSMRRIALHPQFAQ